MSSWFMDTLCHFLAKCALTRALQIFLDIWGFFLCYLLTILFLFYLQSLRYFHLKLIQVYVHTKYTSEIKRNSLMFLNWTNIRADAFSLYVCKTFWIALKSFLMNFRFKFLKYYLRIHSILHHFGFFQFESAIQHFSG